MTVPQKVKLARHPIDLDDDGHEFVELGVTTETDTTLRLAPDGAGGVEWGSGGGGGGTMPWFDVMDYGAVHDGSTDDTSAIQAAIDACMAAGGGTVFFPNGIYAIKGALQDTSTYNSQLEIPQNALTSAEPPISIRFLGMGPVAQSNNGGSGAWVPSLSGAILLSDWNGTITGDPAVIAAGKVDAVYPAASFNWVQVTFENIEVRTHANPKLSAIQMRAAVSCRLSSVTVSTDTASLGMAAPSNTNSVGIDMPAGINSNPPDSFENLFIDGYYTGMRTSEQTNGLDVQVSHCLRGIEFTGGTSINHANRIGKVLAVGVPYVLVFAGAARWVYIDLLDIEHETGTFAPVADIYDPSNFARGFIGWHTTTFGTGPDDNLIVSGASAISLHGGLAGRWRLHNVVDITAGTNPSTNPPSGRRLYTDSSTGHLSARTSAGATIDYESLTPSFATPAVVLGSAAAAGAASTVIRSDSTIVAFDATVPVTQAFGDTAATGSAAVASRRDHKHGMPASPTVSGGTLVIASSHSTPLIFADLIQNSAQDDLVYSS